jgi:hypothetical protein
MRGGSGAIEEMRMVRLLRHRTQKGWSLEQQVRFKFRENGLDSVPAV